MRAWLWSLFDQYVDVREEARRLTEPQATDALFRIVSGALRNVIRGSKGKITEQNADGAAKQIVSRLMKSGQTE